MRKQKPYFKQAIAAKDRFRPNDEPSSANFFLLFDSVPFVLDKDDTAKITEQGLVKLATDQQAIDKREPDYYTDVMSRAVRPHQLPKIINATGDTSITITEVIWDYNLAAVVANTADITHDFTTAYEISVAMPDESWKEIGAGGNMDNGNPVPSFEANLQASASGTMQLRMTGQGKVNFRGGLEATGNINPGDTLLTLPVGYTLDAGNPARIRAYLLLADLNIVCKISTNILTLESPTTMIPLGETIIFSETILSTD